MCALSKRPFAFADDAQLIKRRLYRISHYGRSALVRSQSTQDGILQYHAHKTPNLSGFVRYA